MVNIKHFISSGRRWIILGGVLLVVILWGVLQMMNFFSDEVAPVPDSSQQLLPGHFIFQNASWFFESEEGTRQEALFAGADSSVLLADGSRIAAIISAKSVGNSLLVSDFTLLTEDLPQDHQEIRDYIFQFIDLIKAGEYERLVSDYWTDDVPQKIIDACGNPLDEEGSTAAKQAWVACGYFSDLTVKILQIQDMPTYTLVTVQFLDGNQQPVGLDLHPEWERGHEIVIQKIGDQLRTSNWYFFR